MGKSYLACVVLWRHDVNNGSAAFCTLEINENFSLNGNLRLKYETKKDTIK